MNAAARRPVLTLLGAVITVNAAYTVMIPFIPVMETRAGAGPAVIAGTFALFAAAKMLTQPVGGWLCDRGRPANIALVAMLVCALGTLMTGLARDPVTLLVGRVVWGIGEGLVSPALYAGMSLLCARHDISSSRMMGNFGAAAVAGFMLGPLVAGVAAPVGIQGLFIAGSVLTVAIAVALHRAIAAPRPAESIPAENIEVDDLTDGPESSGNLLRTRTATAGRRWWWAIVLLGLLDMYTYLVYAALEPVLPLYLAGKHPGSETAVISIVFAAGLATSGVTLWALGRWAAQVRSLTLILVGSGVLSMSLPGLALSASTAAVVVVFSVYMIGHSALFLAARRSVLELKSASQQQGRAFGLFGMVSDAGNIIGPLAGVWLWHHTGRGVFVALGLVCVLVALAAAVLRGRDIRTIRGRPASAPDQDAESAEPMAGRNPDRPSARERISSSV